MTKLLLWESKTKVSKCLFPRLIRKRTQQDEGMEARKRDLQKDQRTEESGVCSALSPETRGNNSTRHHPRDVV